MRRDHWRSRLLLLCTYVYCPHEPNIFTLHLEIFKVELFKRSTPVKTVFCSLNMIGNGLFQAIKIKNKIKEDEEKLATPFYTQIPNFA